MLKLNWIHKTLITSVLMAHSLESFAFSKNFIWGTSVTTNLIEGFEGSVGINDWTALLHPGYGVHFWTRYASDIQLAASLSFESFKLSLPWEKINPSPKVFDSLVLDHYRLVLETMRAHGIKPIIVLHEWTNPAWFQQAGGWQSPEAPIYFLEYVKKVYEVLGKFSDTWVVFNDPVYYVTNSYLFGNFPPQLKSADSTFEALYQMIRAYQISSTYIQGAQGAPQGDNPVLKGVGIEQSFSEGSEYLKIPRISAQLGFSNDTLNDRLLQESIADSFLTAIDKNRLAISLPENGSWLDFSRDLPIKDLPPWLIRAPVDWIGISIKQNFITPIQVLDTNPMNSKDFVEKIHKKWPRTAIWISGCGLSLPSQDDEARIYFYENILNELKDLDYLKGFITYSFLDHYDWLNGWTSNFGLVHVDPLTFERTPKPSVKFLSLEIKKLRAL